MPDRALVKSQVDGLIKALNTVLLGKEQQIKLSLACLFAEGYLLIEDLPGMGRHCYPMPWLKCWGCLTTAFSSPQMC